MQGETVKMAYGVISNAQKVIEKLMKAPLPADVAYWLKRNLVSIAKGCKEIEQKRNDLIVKYGEKQENGTYKLTNFSPEFVEEYNKLMPMEFEATINQIEVSKLASVKLTMEEITLIDFLVCEERKIVLATSTIQ
jgi:hypothetical protein